MAFLQKPPDEPYPAFRLVNLLATGFNLWIVYLLYLCTSSPYPVGPGGGLRGHGPGSLVRRQVRWGR